MNKIAKIGYSPVAGQRSAAIISVSFAMILLSALFWTPQPLAVSSQPWKVELLSAIFVIALALWISRTFSRTLNEIAPFRDRTVFITVSFISAFILWSGLSALWARSAGSVAHHTLTWAIYLSILVLTLALMRLRNGYSIIIRAFVLFTLVLGALCLIDYLSIVDFASSEGTIRIRYGKFAELLATIAPFLGAWTLYLRRKGLTFFAVIVWLLSWLTVMLSLSKGAFLASIIGHIVLFTGCIFLSQRRIRRKAAFLAAVWLASTLIVQVAFSVGTSIPATADYISGKADPTRSTTAMRTFTWSVGREMASEHWLTGVGADNFGIAFNTARAELAQKRPGPNSPEIADSYVMERAHNEPLQIFDELGIIGILLFAGAFAAFVFSVIRGFRRNRYRLTPVLWSSIAGMTAFFVSSQVSSFSFRVIQNGVAFFLIVAVAINETAKMRRGETRNAPAKWPKPMIAACTALAGLMIIYCGTKGIAEYYIYQAERTKQFDTAEKYYNTALRFDPDNASAYYYFSSRYASENDEKNAAMMLRKGIDRGLGVTLTYSLLAKHQTLAGDNAAAEKTLSEALGIFPHSVFLRARYAIFLDDHGKPDESAKQMDIARSIDPRQANGWYSIIREGSVAAFYRSQNDPSMAPPAELLPENAVYDYMDDTKFPEPDQNDSDGSN